MPNSLTSIFYGLVGRGGGEGVGGGGKQHASCGFVSATPESEWREMREQNETEKKK